MSKSRIRRPSPAMAVALLSLMIALGGNAFAGKKNKTVKIPRNSITSKHLKKAAVRAPDLAAGAVTAAAIGDGSVSLPKLTPEARNLEVADGSITAAKLADGAVNTTKLAEDAVTPTKITNAAITGPKLADDSVSSRVLAPGGVLSSDIANSAITNSLLASDAVTAPKLAAGSVGTTQLLGSAVTSAKLALNSVTQQVLAANSVGAPQLGSGAVTTTAMAPSIPTVSVTRSFSQTIPGLQAVGTLGVPIVFTSEAAPTAWDSGNLHSTSVNPERLVATQRGVYSIRASVEWEQDADGFRQLTLFKNGAVVHHNAVEPIVSDGSARDTPQEITKDLMLEAGDWVEIRAMQASASCAMNACLMETLDINPNPSFSMTWQHPGA